MSDLHLHSDFIGMIYNLISEYFKVTQVTLSIGIHSVRDKVNKQSCIKFKHMFS